MSLGKRSKKALALLLLISFIPSVSMGENSNGRFSRLQIGEAITFDAWCFDDDAFAIIKAKLEFSESRCQLRLNKSLEETAAKHTLQLGNLETRIENLKEEYESILKIKNKEITELETAALSRPNDYSVWWASGGFVAGALTSILIFMAVSQ